MDSWIGEKSGNKLISLFHKDLSTSAPESLPEGSIVRVDGEIELIAKVGSAHATVLKILGRLGLNPEHPQASEAQAKAFLENSGINTNDLEDLRHLPFITIDNEGSRDLDQALFIQTLDNHAGFRVWYALADASWYVQPGTPLFEQALLRGATFYAPTIAAPMLPRSLSEDLVSLNPDVDRRSLVFVISLDATGKVTDNRISRAAIRSRAQLTYNGVQDFLNAKAEDCEHTLNNQTYTDSLELLKTVGQLRIDLARERNVIEYMRREPQVRACQTDPGRFNITMRARNDVERYNEQISLLCNIEGAKLLEKHAQLTPELQSVYRVHNPPISQRLKILKSQLRELAETRNLDAIWHWDGQIDLSQYLSSLPAGSEYSRMRQAVERQILLSNNASEFSAEAGPHHALGVDAYARFSSPMREVVGIFTHKELLEALQLQTPEDIALDEVLRTKVIATANRSKQVQKKLDKEFQLLVIDHFLHADLDLALEDRPKRPATVMGMRGSRIYVSVDGFALDLKVYASDLESHWNCKYTVENTVARASNPAAPTLHIGDGVAVTTLSWDEERRRFLLDLQSLED